MLNTAFKSCMPYKTPSLQDCLAYDCQFVKLITSSIHPSWRFPTIANHGRSLSSQGKVF